MGRKVEVGGLPTSSTGRSSPLDAGTELLTNFGRWPIVGLLRPTQAILKAKGGIKGTIQLETGCFSNLTEEEVSMLARVPILIMVGDHLGDDPAVACASRMERIKAAGGDMTFVSLPDIGIRGNTHMFMQDRNNVAVADIIIDWIDAHVDGTTR